jgi:hypothetical protein
MNNEKERGLSFLSGFLLIFIVLATLNSGGYRYGYSDQAFYVPAVLERLEPGLFPRDRALIQSQARLTLVDETIASLVRVTRLSVPTLFAALYGVSMTLSFIAVLRLAGELYRTRWAAVCLLAALTLRHEISKTGANTLEGYFHPRQLAFAFGALGLAAFLRGSLPKAAILVGLGALVHPTTALWFAVCLGVAATVADPRLRVPAAFVVAAGVLIGAWALFSGPLAGRLVPMDREWLDTLAAKDYLFPLEWPLSAWIVNLIYTPLIVAAFLWRRQAGLVMRGEREIVIGCVALLVIFALVLPLNAAKVQIAVQMQPARVFWMLDFLATIYVVWALAEGLRPNEARARVAAIAILALSLARGAYVGTVASRERNLVSLDIPDTDWGRVMRWARETPRDSHWLADPGHAYKYGTSVRVAGHRDVFVEAVKDQAIGMYGREVAIRTRDRLAAIGDFAQLTPERARALAVEYGLDYLVSEQRLDLPATFEAGRLKVYRLR